MKTIDIVGESYFGKWDKTRTACRGIINSLQSIYLDYEAIIQTGEFTVTIWTHSCESDI